MSEQSITALAPTGSKWYFNLDPDRRVLICEGLHPNWRDPRDWTEGVTIEPVVWLSGGTVTESELRELYTRIEDSV